MPRSRIGTPLLIRRNPHAQAAAFRMAARRGASSVLVEKGGAMKKIIIATDGSSHAQEAVAFGLELASEQEAEVTFVHVLPPDEFSVAGRLGPAVPIQHREPMDESEAALSEAGEA